MDSAKFRIAGGLLLLALTAIACGAPGDGTTASGGQKGEPSASGCATTGYEGEGSPPADTSAECDDTIGGEDEESPVSSDPVDEQPIPEPGASPVEPQPGQDDVRAIGWESARAQGDDTVKIRFWSGVEPCYVLDRVEVAYGPEVVKITLFEGSAPTDEDVACIELALLKQTTVELEEPLDGRKIVDGTR